MGIPRFFKFISEQFPGCISKTSFKDGLCGCQIDNLYLDANGIIHTMAQMVYFPHPHGFGEGDCRPTRRRSAATPSNMQRNLFRKITTYMDELVKFVKPSRAFYIAIDGPAPMAKQSQQRQRRYKSATTKTPEELAIFDSTCITPGTVFMHKLSQYLHYYIRHMMTTDDTWKKLQVIFSGPDVPGEGEHKIAQYIREMPHRNTYSHCLYGLDADLFMLSLATHCDRFWLLREDQFVKSWSDTFFYIVNIATLKQSLIEVWGADGINANGLIDDFIFMCYLVGNDFLHALPPCHDLSASICFLMDTRKQIFGNQLVTSGQSFNLNNFARIVGELSKVEIQSISVQFYERSKFTNATLSGSLLDTCRPDRGIDLSVYRKLYYKKAGVDADNIRERHLLCKNYMQGLDWVQYYYHAKPLNWHWFYPYHYSPLATDLFEYLMTRPLKLSRVATRIHPPISPFQQLLCVVPPQSSHLLPEHLRCIYTGELSHYYPTQFDIDLEGKLQDWEGIANLPFVDISKLINVYNAAAAAATATRTMKQDESRNVFGHSYEFFSRQSTTYIYRSPYGTIHDCVVSWKTF